MAYLLLTGATGLLGGYLLRDAMRQELPVAVVVRRAAMLEARRRIDAILAPWESHRSLPRPVVLEGDLSQPGLGLPPSDRIWLSQHCRSVLHSAASISFYQEAKTGEPYRTNVDGTRNLIELCRDIGVEQFHHVSTAYVCGRRSGRVLESELDVGQERGNDYEHSKVTAEKLIHSSGLKATIYRPSIIVGDATTGYTTTFHGFYTPLQVAWWLARGGGLDSDVGQWLLGQLGLTGDERKNIVPVDWVSRVIMHLVQTSAAWGRTYHLTSDHPPSANDLVLAIGDAIQERLSTEPDATRAIHGNSISPEHIAEDFRRHMDVYRAYFRDHPEFDTTHLHQAAPHLPCPPVDRELLARTGKYALDANFGWPRMRPPDSSCDVAALLAQLPVDATATEANCVLEITGAGGGAWTLAPSTVRRRSDPNAVALVHQGRIERPQATIRLRCDTLAALVDRRYRVDDALRAGRVAVSASAGMADVAAGMLHALVAQGRILHPAPKHRLPETALSRTSAIERAS